MIKKIFFFFFAVLAVVSIVFTVLLGLSVIQEFNRVSALPGEHSGVDYLAAHMLAGDAVLMGIVALVNILITLFIGMTVQWKK